EHDDEERRSDHDRGRLDPPREPRLQAEPEQQHAERRIAERDRDDGGGHGGNDPVLVMVYPDLRTLRVSWINDLVRWLTSVTRPFSATLKRSAVVSWLE